MSEVTTMQEASLAIAKFEPEEVKCGEAVYTVGRLSWLHFEEIWHELAETVSAFVAADTGRTDATAEAFAGAIATRIRTAPALITKLMTYTVKSGEVFVTPDVIKLWDYDQVLKLAGKAVTVNFKDTKGLFDFFGAVTGIWQSATPSENADPSPST